METLPVIRRRAQRYRQLVCPERMVVETIEEITREKTLLFGASGMLGHALKDVFPHAVFLSRKDADITNQDSVREIIGRHHPATVINAAAYTDVDGCEDNREYAFAVNGRSPGIIAAACAETGATFVHYSTDYIFDGTSMEYREGDCPNPVNVYGQSKLMGETCIQENSDDYRIIRTSWLYGSHGKNFVDTVLALSKQMPVVRVVDDQRGKPTYTVDLAQKTTEILSGKPGMYHITNDGVCSWYEFAQAFIPNAIPCSTAEFPRKATRPAYSVLVNTKTGPLRHWRDAIKEYLCTKGST
jgi:dTDP-4-dehydrorhamnose reductase